MEGHSDRAITPCGELLEGPPSPERAHSELPLLSETPQPMDLYLNLCLLKPRKRLRKQPYFAFRRNSDQAFPGLQPFPHPLYPDVQPPYGYCDVHPTGEALEGHGS